MWELVTHPSNLVFSISICLLFLFAFFELTLLLFGGGTQGILDQLLPADLTSPEVDIDTEAGWLLQVLDWLYLGRVPLLIWFIIFLTIFGLFGLFLQSIAHIFTGSFWSAWILAPASFFLCMPLVRFTAKIVSRVLPQDESTAIFSEELVGRTAIIVLGIAKLHSPAQAKVKDQFGQIHYVLVEPEQDESFKQGQHVILTQKTKIGFQAIRAET